MIHTDHGRYVEINQTTKALAQLLHSFAALRFHLRFQEKRRAERAEQQRIRSEKDKERQARREVRVPDLLILLICSNRFTFTSSHHLLFTVRAFD